MGAENELIPLDIELRIEMAKDEKRGAVGQLIDAKTREMGREPTIHEVRDDHRYLKAKRHDDGNEWERDRLDRRIKQLIFLGEWVLEQVATYPERYDRDPSFADAANGKPRQVTREEVGMVLDHLVELGFLESYVTTPTRGPSTTRYRVTNNGASALKVLEDEG